MPPADSRPRALFIGQVAASSGVTVETIRYYEQLGLLPRPRRTAGRVRRYSDDVLARITFIAQAKALGLSLAEIRDMGPRTGRVASHVVRFTVRSRRRSHRHAALPRVRPPRPRGDADQRVHLLLPVQGMRNTPQTAAGRLLRLLLLLRSTLPSAAPVLC